MHIKLQADYSNQRLLHSALDYCLPVCEYSSVHQCTAKWGKELSHIAAWKKLQIVATTVHVMLLAQSDSKIVFIKSKRAYLHLFHDITVSDGVTLLTKVYTWNQDRKQQVSISVP